MNAATVNAADWISRTNALPHVALSPDASAGVSLICTCGSDLRLPDLGFAADGRATSPEDRRDAAAAVDASPGQLVFMEQVHGGAVATVDQSHAGAGLDRRTSSICGVDAMVTGSDRIALAGLSADCPLIGLWDNAAGLVALAHAGWRGLVAGVLPATVGRMIDLGADRARIAAVVGPAIGPCCYEVGHEVIDAFNSAGRPVPPECSTARGDRVMLDLFGVARRQLVLAGINLGRITQRGGCTACGPDHLHSYRREGERAGRQAMILRRRKAR